MRSFFYSMGDGKRGREYVSMHKLCLSSSCWKQTESSLGHAACNSNTRCYKSILLSFFVASPTVVYFRPILNNKRLLCWFWLVQKSKELHCLGRRIGHVISYNGRQVSDFYFGMMVTSNPTWVVIKSRSQGIINSLLYTCWYEYI